MKTKELTISGMSCNHCVMHVRKALSGVDGVTVQDVQIGRAQLTVDESRVADRVLSEAVAKAGYQVVGITEAV